MKWFLTGLLTLMFVGCSTIEVRTDYDPNFKFLEMSSFKVEHQVKEGESSLVNDRLTTAIKNDISQKGYQLENTKSDLVFDFFYITKDKTDIQTSYTMVGGFGRVGWGSGAMISTTDTYDYTEGTLVIDAKNAATNKTVWRGVGVLELKEQKTPEEKTAYINNIVAKILESYPSKTTKE